MILSGSESLHSTSSSGISSDLFDNFPVLAQFHAASPTNHTSSSSSSLPSPSSFSAAVLSLPGLLLESAKSHVLDEPVPRLSKADTLPWDCSLQDLALFTVCGSGVRHMLQPLALRMTLASQQEGLGITVHSDMLALSLSKKQVSASPNPGPSP